MNVVIPWGVSDYMNAYHPLFNGLLQRSYEGIAFRHVRNPQYAEDIIEAGKRFTRTAVAWTRAFVDHPVVRHDDIVAFINSRSVLVEAALPRETDVVFHHAMPNTLGNQDFIFHTENLTTLFFPLLRQGWDNQGPLRARPVFWMVRHLLEQPSCLAIFTHLSRTVDEIRSAFASPVIDRKVRHTPLGCHLTPEQESRLDAAVARKMSAPPDRPIRMLFTNSHAGGAGSFMFRGGLDVLRAYLFLRKEIRIALDIYGELPPLPPEIERRLRDDNLVTLHETFVSDDEILDAFGAADIVLLPSFGMHAVTVVRAMMAGAVCITSDAPGFEEFIQDGVDGFRVPGRLAQAFTVDEETGWMRDDFSGTTTVNTDVVRELIAVIAQLHSDPMRRRSIGLAARQKMQQRFPFEGWARAFGDILEEVRRTRTGGREEGAGKAD